MPWEVFVSGGSRVVMLACSAWLRWHGGRLLRILTVAPGGEQQKIAEDQPGGHHNGKQLFEAVGHGCPSETERDHRL